MAAVFHQLSRPAMEGLMEVIARNRIRLPCHPSALANIVPNALMSEVAISINQLSEQGMQGQHLAYMLKLLVEERVRSLGTDCYLLPIALWQHEVITLAQLDQVYDWWVLDSSQ